MDILGIIPARGGSKGIPRKNLHPLAGKPLIAHTVEAALGSRCLTRVILSSDCPEIMRVVAALGVEVPFARPESLAGDNVPMLPVIRHAVDSLEAADGYRPDYIVLLQPTSPLRRAEHIDEALQRLVGSDADSIVSVVKVPHQYAPVSVMVLEGDRLRPYLPVDETRNLRQLKPSFYARNGAAIYAFTRQCLLEQHSIYGKTILAYEMRREDSVDIDEMLDLRFCEMLLRERTSPPPLPPLRNTQL